MYGFTLRRGGVRLDPDCSLLTRSCAVRPQIVAVSLAVRRYVVENTGVKAVRFITSSLLSPPKRAVLAYLGIPLETGKQYWAKGLPEALRDGRVEFEVHDFFNANPRKGPNVVYWMRYIMRESPTPSCFLHDRF